MINRIRDLSGFKVGKLPFTYLGVPMIVWCNATIPKHQFITWLGIRQRLLTRDRLVRMRLSAEDNCCLCSRGVDSHSHLFFKCDFSRNCWKQTLDWLKVQMHHFQMQYIVQWLARNCEGDRVRRQASCTAVNALVYSIWKVRNDRIWSNRLWTVEQVVAEVQHSVKTRILFVNRNSNRLNGSWFQNV
ncbi:hypothetical protein RDABS01_007932 [Bienertia sinuspersici]